MENANEIVQDNSRSDEVDINIVEKAVTKYHSLYERQTLCDVILIAGIDNRR